MVHRPGPRVVVYGAMVFLLAIMLPGYVLEPARMLGGGGVVGLVVLIAFQVLLLSIARRRVILTVDARMTTLTLRDVRWPFPGRSRQVPVAELRGVTRQKAPRGLSVRLAFVLSGGVEMPLTNSYFGDTGHMARDAAAIRKLCGLPEAPPA
jgi:hypothetical protein